MKNLQIGQRVHAVKMAPDSFYLQVRGTLTGIRNGFAQIEATEVMDRGSKKWKEHPTSCATSAKVENVVQLRPKPEIKLTVGHYGGNFLNTSMELSGRGITKVGERSAETGNYLYRVTDKALSIIEANHNVYYEMPWD